MPGSIQSSRIRSGVMVLMACCAWCDVAGFEEMVAVAAQGEAEDLADGGLVFDDEYVGAHGGSLCVCSR
jgi:hypothetical protein